LNTSVSDSSVRSLGYPRTCSAASGSDLSSLMSSESPHNGWFLPYSQVAKPRAARRVRHTTIAMMTMVLLPFGLLRFMAGSTSAVRTRVRCGDPEEISDWLSNRKPMKIAVNQLDFSWLTTENTLEVSRAERKGARTW